MFFVQTSKCLKIEFDTFDFFCERGLVIIMTNNFIFRRMFL